MDTITVGEGAHSYRWQADWALGTYPNGDTPGWAHHGIAITSTGEVATYHPAEDRILIFDQDGALLRSWSTGLTEGHGITYAEEDGVGYLWIADPGVKIRRTAAGPYEPDWVEGNGVVAKFRVDDGTRVLTLPTPDIEAYRDGRYSPTNVTVDEVRRGGSGDVWVADGYGQSYVHRFSADGTLLQSLNGEESAAGRYDCPHAVVVDRRRADRPQLCVADRANSRLLFYSLDGILDRIVPFEYKPSMFAIWRDLLIVADLRGRIALVDLDDRVVAYLGDNHDVSWLPGFPNMLDDSGAAVRTDRLEVGKFNSPHGLAVDEDGNLYIAEYLIGGRFTKLVRA